MRHLALLLPLALGCRTFINEGEQTDRLAEFDRDGDGAYDADRGGDDCDDDNAEVAPGATEVCDGVDNDCDGAIDEDLSALQWPDGDGDGFGDADAEPQQACNGAAGWSTNNTDCDDANGQVKPGASEQCNDLDDDCNGTVDDGFAQTWYADTDADGYGDPDATLSQCNPPTGYTDVADDCDDTDANVNPLAEEACNGVDDDCDGLIDADDEDVSGQSFWYADADGDGFGDASTAPVLACEAPGEAWVDNATDCDDAVAATYPGAEDLCGDGIDNDCNGIPDDGQGVSWGVDGDGDGFGEKGGLEVRSCDAPGSGWAPNVDDCDDASPQVHPDADERCNGKDDDCDGTVDQNPDASGWWVDEDGDGFGDAERPAATCPPSPTVFPGHAPNSTDCDDGNIAAYPNATESCRDLGVDNDCDGNAAEEGNDPLDWYVDSDRDGFGLAADSVTSCAPPPGRVTTPGDCDDGAPAINPDGEEICNNQDDDCNGLVDDDASDAGSWYVDADDDGYGRESTPVKACSKPAFRAPNADDCDDLNATRRPGAAEQCNGLDDDCDDQIDEDSPPPATWYLDTDNDGFGVAGSTQVSCAKPPGYVAVAGDCAPTNPAINPAAAETCDSTDRNCDGDPYAGATDTTTFYRDEDGDTWGRASTTQAACVLPPGYAARAGDCADLDAQVNPGATERCNGKDDDCNGTIDGSASVDAGTWWPDRDGDTFGNSATPARACSAPPAHVAGTGTADCDDTSAAKFPGNPEICDGLDNDCNGVVDQPAPGTAPLWYQDADGDNVGGSTSQRACAKPNGYVASTNDCDDTDPDSFPGNTALACDDAADNNCDGEVDNDLDGDGLSDQSCGGSDCDDTDPDIGLVGCSAIEVAGPYVWLDARWPKGRGVSVSNNEALLGWSNLGTRGGIALIGLSGSTTWSASGTGIDGPVVRTNRSSLTLPTVTLTGNRTVFFVARTEQVENKSYPLAWAPNAEWGITWRRNNGAQKTEIGMGKHSATDDHDNTPMGAWQYAELRGVVTGGNVDHYNRAMQRGASTWHTDWSVRYTHYGSETETLALGAWEAQADRQSDTSWSLLLIYNRALTTQEITDIRAEISSLYGFSPAISGP